MNQGTDISNPNWLEEVVRQPAVPDISNPSWFRELLKSPSGNPSVRLAEMMAKAAYQNNQTEAQKQDAIRPYFYKARQDAQARQAKILEEIAALEAPPIPDMPSGEMGKADYVAALLGGLIRPGSINESLAHMQGVRRSEAESAYARAMAEYQRRYGETADRRRSLEAQLRDEEKFLRDLDMEEIRHGGREQDNAMRMEREMARALIQAARHMTPEGRKALLAENPWLAPYADAFGVENWEDRTREATVEDRLASADLKRKRMDFMDIQGDTEKMRQQVMEAQAELSKARAETENALRGLKANLTEEQIKWYATRTELLPQETASRIALNMERARNLRETLILKQMGQETDAKTLAREYADMPKFVTQLYLDRRQAYRTLAAVQRQANQLVARGQYTGEIRRVMDEQIRKLEGLISSIDAEISSYKPIVDATGISSSDLIPPAPLPNLGLGLGGSIGDGFSGAIGISPLLPDVPPGFSVPTGPIGPPAQRGTAGQPANRPAGQPANRQANRQASQPAKRPAKPLPKGIVLPGGITIPESVVKQTIQKAAQRPAQRSGPVKESDIRKMIEQARNRQTKPQLPPGVVPL